MSFLSKMRKRLTREKGLPPELKEGEPKPINNVECFLCGKLGANKKYGVWKLHKHCKKEMKKKAKGMPSRGKGSGLF